MLCSPRPAPRALALVLPFTRRGTLRTHALALLPRQAVKHLDFSAGKLRSLAGIDIFANLETIIVDNNLLDSLSSAGTIPSVRTLSLNFNAVYCLDAVLTCIHEKFPKLTFLSLLGNPCCASELYGSTTNQYEAYCAKVADTLKDLKFLDSGPVIRKPPK